MKGSGKIIIKGKKIVTGEFGLEDPCCIVYNNFIGKLISVLITKTDKKYWLKNS